MRPNWDPYDIWLGAYGSVNGHLTYYERDREQVAKLSGQDKELLELAQLGYREAAEHAKYTRGWESHPRYKSLTPTTDDTVHDNNLAFTGRVMFLNDKRVGRLMREGKLAAMLFPTVQNTLGCYSEETGALLPLEMARNLISGPVRKKYPRESPDRGLEDLSNIYELFGIDTNDWSISFNTDGRFAFSSRFGTPGSPFNEFREAVFGSEAGSIQCLKVKESIQKTFSRPSLAAYARGERPESFLKACAKCHTGAAPKAPPISFDNPEKLRQELRGAGFDRGTLLQEIKYRLSEEAPSFDRMPEGFHLAPHQTAILVNYLEGLAK